MGYLKATNIDNICYDFCTTKKYGDDTIIATLKSDIEKSISTKGLQLRFANLNDIEKLSNFQKEIFYPHTATLESQYELFRIIKFGYALLLENPDNELLGFYTTIHYGTIDKIGYGIRVGISSRLAGHNLAAQLAKYATILAYENKCKSFTALMSPKNFRSASNVLNHVGYYCEKFHRNLPSFGTRFEIKLPLSLETFYNTEIDFNKVIQFIKKNSPDRDYMLFQPTEIDKMEIAYTETDFKIIAFLKTGLIDNNDYFFAIKPIDHQ